MPNLVIDFRLVGPGAEVSALRTSLETLEQQLKDVTAKRTDEADDYVATLDLDTEDGSYRRNRLTGTRARLSSPARMNRPTPVTVEIGLSGGSTNARSKKSPTGRPCSTALECTALGLAPVRYPNPVPTASPGSRVRVRNMAPCDPGDAKCSGMTG